MRNSAENLAYTSLELGGKSPVVVFADADLDSAANAMVAGIFAATGQSCVAGSRLYRRAAGQGPACSRSWRPRREAIRIGDPQDLATEMGPLATARQREHIEALIGHSIAAGATRGHRRPRAGGSSDGFYFGRRFSTAPATRSLASARSCSARS